MLREFSIAAFALSVPIEAIASEQAMMGKWARGDGKANVRVERCGSEICAINTWIKPGTESEKVGDKLIMDIEPTGNGKLSGKANDPQRGLTYKMKVSVSGDTMTTRGCVLGNLICRSVNWSRIR